MRIRWLLPFLAIQVSALAVALAVLTTSTNSLSVSAQSARDATSTACRLHDGLLGTISTAPPPAIGAQSAAVLHRGTGRVLYEVDGRRRRAPASTTKIMTAIVALERISDENAIIEATANASNMPGSSVMGLWPGAPITYRDLLFGLMLPSGNDAAIDLAVALGPGESVFLAAMNQKASALGMVDTHFSNPHGLDAPNHYMSAIDLAKLSDHAMSNARFREIAGATSHMLPRPFEYALHNGNSLLGTYQGANGVKIGWTEDAGWTFAASAERDGEEVIVALLNTPDRDRDASALLDWAFEQRTWTRVDPATVIMIKSLSSLAGVDLLQTIERSCASAREQRSNTEEGG